VPGGSGLVNLDVRLLGADVQQAVEGLRNVGAQPGFQLGGVVLGQVLV
jgi:hypothetical protein